MTSSTKSTKIYSADCVDWLKKAGAASLHLSFLDPPFNQGKDYRFFDDKQNDADYWRWMTEVLSLVRAATAEGGAVYFMQREKNAEFVLRALRESGWNLRNLIVWKKKSSAVPCRRKYGLQYQIIAAAVNGDAPRVFNRLRISPPLPANYKIPRKGGIYVTDVWDDIRELTSGYFAGDEALRNDSGERFHKQQAPLALLTRIILSSSHPGDVVFDPFAGTGTTLVASALLGRKGIGVEIDPLNVECVRRRVRLSRKADIDGVRGLYDDYIHTDELDKVWGARRLAPMRQDKTVAAKPPLRYPGGKQRAVGILAEYLPPDETEFCSPFLGGGSFELYCAGLPDAQVFAYDDFAPLVEFWQTLLSRRTALADEVAAFLPSLPRARFYELQKEQHRLPTKLARAAAFYVINRASFSGCTLSGGMSPGHPRFTPSAVLRLRTFPAARVRQAMRVQRKDFADSIAAHPEAFIYADPPYWLKNQNLYGMRGVQQFDHDKLHDILMARGGRWLLSYNDCAEVKRLYGGCAQLKKPRWRYGMSNDKNSRELLILSAELAEVLAQEQQAASSA